MSLKKHNTFGLPANARQVVICNSIHEITKAYQETQKLGEPFLILGEGSNVVFLEDFKGTVVINRIKGLDISEVKESWCLHVAAGENWHELVKRSLEAGIPGLENLALIPGCVGSAPIQNIGAYGLEFKDVCDYVDILNLNDESIRRLSRDKCEFAYRESVFKRNLKTGFVIVAVGLRLSKKWTPILTYGDLSKLDPNSVTPLDIFEAVCNLRSSKLPDPKVIGNAGSFFKNPVVNQKQARELLNKFPTMPNYPQENGVKLAAGWLIDQCQLKGYRIGGSAVYNNQALVLVNLGSASGEDIKSLASHVRRTVAAKFGVYLEPEVRFIGASDEINAIELFT